MFGYFYPKLPIICVFTGKSTKIGITNPRFVEISGNVLSNIY